MSLVLPRVIWWCLYFAGGRLKSLEVVDVRVGGLSLVAISLLVSTVESAGPLAQCKVWGRASRPPAALSPPARLGTGEAPSHATIVYGFDSRVDY